MDLGKLTIGQMAELNRTTTQTLRHYDKIGLLSPCCTDPHTGYRYYHINQSARLDMIQYLKACGIQLEEIKQQLETDDPREIRERLARQYATITKTIEMLAKSRSAIARSITNYERYDSLPKNETIFLEHTAARKIYLHVSDKNFFEQNDSGYEMMLRELKSSLHEKELPASYFCNVGTIVRKKYLDKNELFSNEVFVFVEEDYSGPGAIETIPEGTFLSLCSREFFKEAELARKLIHHAANAGYTIAGDYICEVIAEFPVFNDAPRGMFFKIQIPIAV